MTHLLTFEGRPVAAAKTKEHVRLKAIGTVLLARLKHPRADVEAELEWTSSGKLVEASGMWTGFEVHTVPDAA